MDIKTILQNKDGLHLVNVALPMGIQMTVKQLSTARRITVKHWMLEAIVEKVQRDTGSHQGLME
jgi:hypothetical protein